MATLAQAQSISVPRRVFYVFAGLLGLASLEAYAIGPVPLEWIAESGIIGLALLLFVSRPFRMPIEFRGYMVYLVYAVVVTVIHVGLTDYARLHPVEATTPYPIYMALRFASWLSFLGSGAVAFWLYRNGEGETLMRAVVALGCFVAALSIYIYFATLLGWPEPPRTRIGTGGREQSTVFSYAFHRALGTFREPSHLAAFLVLPFFLSLRRRKGLIGGSTLLLGLSMLLTGSLAGILGTLAGFLGGTLTFGLRSVQGVRVLVAFLMAVGAGFVGFGILAQGTEADEANLIGVLTERVVPVLEARSLQATNRGMVYEYIEAHPPSPLGIGFGHANMIYSRDTQQTLIGSFQSLYIAGLYSLGYPGLFLLFAGSLLPVLRAFAVGGRGSPMDWSLFLGAYLAWLTVFAGLYDEPQVWFGLSVALLAGLGASSREDTPA